MQNKPLPLERKTVHARFAVSTVFFLLGLLFASWVSRIPAVAEHLNLNEAQLGVALLGVAVGALLAFPLSGWATSRFGSRMPTWVGITFMAVALPLVTLAQDLVGLTLLLLLVGAGNGGTDVAMNSHAVEVENRHHKPIMSSFHALFSVGGIAGALLGGLMAKMNISPQVHFLAVSAFSLLVTFLVRPMLLKVPGTGEQGPVFAAPPRKLLGLGIVIFCVAIGEGAIGDWSAVYLKETLKTSEATATAGYLAFSVAMVLGRVLGDNMRARMGAVMLVGSGCLVAAGGLLMGLLIPQPWAALLGFAAVGWGLSSGFPVAFSAAGKFPGVHPGIAMAAVATMGYTGFLLGPPVIGFLAHLTTLTWGLGLVVLLALVAALFSKNVQVADQST